MTDGNTIRSVAKAMELLQLLSDAGEAMTLTAISERAGLPKSTVFGLLTTMRDYDVITQHADGKYALGLRLFEYGCRASAFWNISSLARPYLEHLAEATPAPPPCSPSMKTGTSWPSIRPRGATAFGHRLRTGGAAAAALHLAGQDRPCLHE